jgi:hypothetical protein
MNGLPELNTQGIDITNTLAKINTMKHNDMVNQNLQSEIESRNALEVLKTKSAALTDEKTNLEITEAKNKDMIKGALWVKSHPDPISAYEKLRGVYPELADGSFFVGTDKEGRKVWNVDKFNTYVDGGRDAVELARHPKDGADVFPIIPNPAYKKDMAISAANSPMIKVRLVSNNGKLVQDKDYPIEPVVDNIAKDIRDERRLDETERYNRAKETRSERKETRLENKEDKPKQPSIKELLEMGMTIDSKDVTEKGAQEVADTYNRYKGDSMYIPNRVVEKTIIGGKTVWTSDPITKFKKVDIIVDPTIRRRPTYEEFVAAAERTGKSLESVVTEYNARAKKVKSK